MNYEKQIEWLNKKIELFSTIENVYYEGEALLTDRDRHFLVTVWKAELQKLTEQISSIEKNTLPDAEYLRRRTWTKDKTAFKTSLNPLEKTVLEMILTASNMNQYEIEYYFVHDNWRHLNIDLQDLINLINRLKELGYEVIVMVDAPSYKKILISWEK